MAGTNHMDNNQPERKSDNVLFYTTGGTAFEIEEYFDGTQTYPIQHRGRGRGGAEQQKIAGVPIKSGDARFFYALQRAFWGLFRG